MSYILDALRKSDQQRQLSATPTLRWAQSAPLPSRQPMLLYGLLALALVGAGVAIGWWRPWQHEQTPVALRLAGRQPELTSSQPAPVASERVPGPVPSARAPSAAPDAPSASLPTPGKPQALAVAAPEKSDAPDRAATDASQKAAGPGAELRGITGAAGTPAQTVISMAELPVSIQQELPVMSITVHAHAAKPGDRLVGINNRLLREGDEVAPGLRLEQITGDGMILSYRGYNFRRGIR